jgi:hypothetical protein
VELAEIGALLGPGAVHAESMLPIDRDLRPWVTLVEEPGEPVRPRAKANRRPAVDAAQRAGEAVFDAARRADLPKGAARLQAQGQGGAARARRALEPARDLEGARAQQRAMQRGDVLGRDLLHGDAFEEQRPGPGRRVPHAQHPDRLPHDGLIERFEPELVAVFGAVFAAHAQEEVQV